MNILVTNDDGINAAGLKALKEAMETLGHVTVVAPEAEMSAVGHSITISNPLRVRRVQRNGEEFGLAVNGTPADCVKIAVRALMSQPPDLVVSGINHGQNVATNVIYSGTVSAATEGMILGIPALAVSVSSFTPGDFSAAAQFAVTVARETARRGLPEGTLLNVNVPSLPFDQIKGIKLCRQGRSVFREVFERRVDPRQNDYYWQGGAMQVDERDADADIEWLTQGWVTVTPLHFDLTSYSFMRRMDEWDLFREE